MVVRKSFRHRVVTLAHGAFTAVETELVCRAGCTQPSGAKVARRSAALRALVPRGSIYGYDVEVFVGLQRCVAHRQREEIREALREDHGIEVSGGEVSALAARFLGHLEALQRQSAQRLAEALARDGGYPRQGRSLNALGPAGGGRLVGGPGGVRGWGATCTPVPCAHFRHLGCGPSHPRQSRPSIHEGRKEGSGCRLANARLRVEER